MTVLSVGAARSASGLLGMKHANGSRGQRRDGVSAFPLGFMRVALRLDGGTFWNPVISCQVVESSPSRIIPEVFEIKATPDHSIHKSASSPQRPQYRLAACARSPSFTSRGCCD